MPNNAMITHTMTVIPKCNVTFCLPFCRRNLVHSNCRFLVGTEHRFILHKPTNTLPALTGIKCPSR